MKTVLLEPQDTLFFRDGIPMSAGQGRGAGCRLPFPNTWHEAVRAALLATSGPLPSGRVRGRSRNSDRNGKWSAAKSPGDERLISSTAFQSLQTLGPLPHHTKHGTLWPMPMDLVAVPPAGKKCPSAPTQWETLRLLKLDSAVRDELVGLSHAAVSPVGPEKNQPSGWWTTAQMAHYLCGNVANLGHPIPTQELWQEEYRIGVAIDPSSQAARDGELFSGTYLRPAQETKFVAVLQLKRPNEGEDESLARLDHILLGGDRRMVRLSQYSDWLVPAAPDFSGDGPVWLKWTLVTPAVFAHGWLPGWLMDTQGNRSAGEVCLKGLSAACRLGAVCLGKPETIAGWDIAAATHKPTQLAASAGSVYYFHCQTTEAASQLASLLHWRPRSDHYGEKGYGYGLCGRVEAFLPTSRDVRDNHKS